MTTADDSRLLQLAAHPAEEVFLVLNRPQALLPLLVLLAVLPGLFALHYRTFRERGARWALRGLEVATAETLDEIVDPAVRAPEDVLRWQPPLGSWLTGGVMRLLGPDEPLVLYVVPYLSAAALVAMIYLLFRRLAGPRFGLLTAALVSCHGPFLAQVQTPVPLALSLLLAVIAFWGFLAHLQEASGLVTVKLLLSGIALGLCLLAGGPLALVVLAVLLLYVLGLRGVSLRKRRDRPAEPQRVWVGWPAIKSTGVLALTAFAAGGWWVLMMSSRHGGEFLHGFLLEASGRYGLLMQEPVASSPSFSAAAALGATHLLGVLLGLAVFGGVRAVLDVVRSDDEPRRRGPLFLLAWTAGGLLIWLARLRRIPLMGDEGFSLSLWDGFLLLPCVALAAYFVDEAARRRVHVVTVAAATCVGFGSLLAAATLPGAGVAAAVTPILSAALLLAVFVVAVVWISGLASSGDARLRLVLGALLLAHVFADGAAGLRLVRAYDDDDRALASFRTSLRELPEAEACLIIRERRLPQRLTFTLRSLWPQAELQTVESWDAALSQVLSEGAAGRKVVVLDWAPPQLRPANLQVPGLLITQVSTPYFFERRELRTYLVVRES